MELGLPPLESFLGCFLNASGVCVDCLFHMKVPLSPWSRSLAEMPINLVSRNTFELMHLVYLKSLKRKAMFGTCRDSQLLSDETLIILPKFQISLPSWTLLRDVLLEALSWKEATKLPKLLPMLRLYLPPLPPTLQFSSCGKQACNLEATSAKIQNSWPDFRLSPNYWSSRDWHKQQGHLRQQNYKYRKVSGWMLF